MDSLPLEVHVRILVEVPAHDLLAAACVCQAWASLLAPDKVLPTPPVTRLSFTATHGSVSDTQLSEDDDREPPHKRAKTDPAGIVWKCKAREQHNPWYQILTISGFSNYKWLCLACAGLVTQMDMSNGFTGTGYIASYHSSSTAAMPNDDVAGPDALAGAAVVGSVKYQQSYVGDFVQGKFDGLGLCLPVGVVHQAPGEQGVMLQDTTTFDFYCGYWHAGREHGMGRCSWGRGESTHEGMYRKGVRHGHGFYEWKRGETRYVGDFRKHTLWGVGTLTWPGGRSKGEWKMNKQHGNCTTVWTDSGCKFVGKYKYGKRKSGTYTWIDGGSFKGKWNDNVRHGQAEVRCANGLVFYGMYKNDVRDGPGTLTWPDGDSYTGTWSLNRRWGSGTFTCARTGRVQPQVWKEDVSVRYTEKLPEKYPDQQQVTDRWVDWHGL